MTEVSHLQRFRCKWLADESWRLRPRNLNPVVRDADTVEMRGLAAALLLLLASPAAAGPIRVEIQTGAPTRDPFVVSVIGHYADFHNGTSRRWKDVPLRAGARRFIPLGPVNPLLNMGVSVAVYHPEYVTERARSDRTPLLVRPVGFETFHPRPWRRLLAEGGVPDNGGPDFLLGQILGHLQLFLLTYLPVIDAAEGDLSASDESLRGHLAVFDELARAAMTEEAARQTQRLVPSEPEQKRAYALRIAERDRGLRADVRDQLHRIREWLSLSREERVAMRRLMEDMRYARSVGEKLLDESDRMQIGALLDRYREDLDAGRQPQPTASWTNPHNRVEYRVRVIERPGECSRLGIHADLTGVVSADLGDMTNDVAARFCRRASGGWRYEAS